MYFKNLFDNSKSSSKTIIFLFFFKTKLIPLIRFFARPKFLFLKIIFFFFKPKIFLLKLLIFKIFFFLKFFFF